MEIDKVQQSHREKQNYVSQRPQSVKSEKEERPFVRRDSLESASAMDSGIRLSGNLPENKQLDLYEPSREDGIDWDYVSFRMSSSVSLEAGNQIMRHVNSAVSVYVTTKARLEEHYAGQEEILSQKTEKLDHMFEQFKQRTVNSWQQSVGEFYEQLGNKGIKDRMGANLSAAIDQQANDMEAAVKAGRFDEAKENSWQLLEIALDVSSLEEEQNGTIFHHPVQEGEDYYSLNDLQAAGTAAKEASAIKAKILNLSRDENLEIQMTLQHRKLLDLLEHLTAGKEMNSIIRQSMKTFMGHISDSISGKQGEQNERPTKRPASSFSVYA